jgi:hypothetical protein
MQRGSILETARKDTSSAMMGGALLLLVCTGVLAINWKYVYNFIAGPVPFTAALSTSPGAQEWVTASGTLVPTGLSETITVGLLRGAVESTTTTARFMMMSVEGRPLIVKVGNDFSGSVVSGRLVPLPATLATDSSTGVYPWYIDAKNGYRWDFNLFVMIAGPSFPIFLLLTLGAAYTRMNPLGYPPIAYLKRFGNPLQVVDQIEAELASAGPSAYISPLWIGPTWVVGLASGVKIFKLDEIVAVAYVTTEARGSKPATHAVRFWVAGQVLYYTITMSAKEAHTVLAALDSRVPGIVADDAAVFDKRWARDRAECERDAKARAERRRIA